RPAVAEFVDVKSGRAVVGHDDHVGRSIVEDDAAAMTAAATVAAVMAAVMAAAAMAPAACVFGGLQVIAKRRHFILPRRAPPRRPRRAEASRPRRPLRRKRSRRAATSGPDRVPAQTARSARANLPTRSLPRTRSPDRPASTAALRPAVRI